MDVPKCLPRTDKRSDCRFVKYKLYFKYIALLFLSSRQMSALWFAKILFLHPMPRKTKQYLQIHVIARSSPNYLKIKMTSCLLFPC